jgi:hypothetical protein
MADEAAITEAEDAAAVPYDTADPQVVNTARKKAARLRRGRLDVVAGLMGLAEGRAWVYDFLESCHCFSTSFVQGDPHATSFKEGERNPGLRLLADVMAAAPDQYVTMCKESKGR